MGEQKGRDPQAIREQLQRILASSVFLHSERLRRFLAHCVEAELSGRVDDLKEYTIGVAAFDRPKHYNPAEDPIVRVEARRLRKKLEEYYQTRGSADPVVIEIPKGGYLPIFTSRRREIPSGRQVLFAARERCVVFRGGGVVVVERTSSCTAGPCAHTSHFGSRTHYRSGAFHGRLRTGLCLRPGEWRRPGHLDSAGDPKAHSQQASPAYRRIPRTTPNRRSPRMDRLSRFDPSASRLAFTRSPLQGDRRSCWRPMDVIRAILPMADGSLIGWALRAAIRFRRPAKCTSCLPQAEGRGG